MRQYCIQFIRGELERVSAEFYEQRDGFFNFYAKAGDSPKYSANESVVYDIREVEP